MRKIKVALADDNVAFTELLSDYFEIQSDIELIGIAHDGDQTCTLIADLKPDVLLLDMAMPKLSGLGVLEFISALPLQTRPKVIVLSALSQQHQVHLALELGADCYFIKPVHFDLVIEKIKAMMQTAER